MLHTTQGRPFAGAPVAQRAKPVATSRVSRGSLQVTNAITRQKKEQIVSNLKEKLDTSVVVFGMRFKGLDVQTVEKFRRGIPEKCSVVVTKNSLMRIACNEVPGWSAVGENGCSGENAWVFVHEEDIAAAAKYFHTFADELERAAKANAPKGTEPPKPTSISCAVMDNKVLSPAEFKQCENLPTKTQLIATIARLLKQPAQKIAVGVKQVPSKLAYGIKALAELDEDKSKIVGDVAKPKAA